MDIKEIKKPKYKILLMEDYPDLARFYLAALRAEKFEVILEDDEDQGVEIMLKEIQLTIVLVFLPV